ncbi:MAG: hypothetical protein IKS41_03880 [Alphaproteobacteria bacterium]|nr:hypothetical protein [Alphaproteobacteria bacterium]
MKIKFLIMGGILCAFAGGAMAQLAADPWATKSAAQEKIQKQSSAPNTLHQQLPQFVGENTTWNTAMGQREIAPDANITNMLLMTQHLRNMGYQIPDGLDNLISTAPKKLRNEIAQAMAELKRSSHPIARIENELAAIFEKNTGLSLENLIMNSLRIIDARR